MTISIDLLKAILCILANRLRTDDVFAESREMADWLESEALGHVASQIHIVLPHLYTAEWLLIDHEASAEEKLIFCKDDSALIERLMQFESEDGADYRADLDLSHPDNYRLIDGKTASGTIIESRLHLVRLRQLGAES